jgi:hypothetical protein
MPDPIAASSNTIVSLKIHGEEVVMVALEKMTLGDWRLVKRHFGVVGQTAFLQGIHDEDPDAICAFIYMALLRKHPEWEHERLMNTVEDLAADDIQPTEVDLVKEADPKAEALDSPPSA